MTEYHFESDAALSSRCLDVLVQNVGLLETERFIAHLSRESADYTKWRENQFEDLSLEELGQETRKSGETIRRACEVEAILKKGSAVRKT